MKPLMLFVAPAVLSSLMFASCGTNKNSIDAPSPSVNSNPSGPAKGPDATPATVASDIDQRVFGKWIVVEAPLKDKSSGKDIPGLLLRMTLSVSKDTLTTIVESIQEGIITCTAKAEITAFSLTKTQIVINDSISKQIELPAQNTKCSVEMKKSTMDYILVSDDDLKLKNTESNQYITAKRMN